MYLEGVSTTSASPPLAAVMMALMGETSPAPIGATAAVSLSGKVGIAIVDIAAPDMLRVKTAAVVVGIIVGEIARSDRQVKSTAAPATAMLDRDHTIPGAFIPGTCAGLERGRPGRCGIGHWRDGEETDRR
jgi:hypothetical protein